MSSRHGLRWWPVFKRPGNNSSKVTIHPARVGLLGLMALFLIWLVLTKSLPYVFAPIAPQLALWLAPDHPVALEVQANRARARLLELVTAESLKTRQKKESESQGSDATISFAAPDLVSDKQSREVERKELREKIRVLAKKILTNDPLNARAFRLLGEVENDPDRVRILMREAVKRSRRESVAVFWLLNDSFHRKEYKKTLELADILLRTRPALNKYVMSYLGQIAQDTRGRELLLERLVAHPSWRSLFFSALPRHVKFANTPLELMMALKDAGHPPSPADLNPYLSFLLAKKLVDPAYNAWLQLLPDEELATLGLVYNPSFESTPSSLPFDWQIGRPVNATVDFTLRDDEQKGRALHMSFVSGRVTFPTMRQILMLSPGRYRLSLQYHGKIIAKRGLRWRLSCFQNQRKMLAETDMLMGVQSRWRTIVRDIEVPDIPECRAQVLQLLHDARSASEHFITGQVWFDELELSRLGAE